MRNDTAVVVSAACIRSYCVYFLYFDNTSTVIWWWWTTYRIQERWYIQKKLYCFENYEQITCSRPILLWLLLRCAGWVDLLSFLLSPDTTILCTRTCIYIYIYIYTHTHTHTYTHTQTYESSMQYPLEIHSSTQSRMQSATT